MTAAGAVHKYLRHIFLEHFGAEILKEKLLTQIEAFINKTLCSWSSQESVEVKNAASVVNDTRHIFTSYILVLMLYCCTRLL